MCYPDLLLTKSVAFRRREAQRASTDPYARPAARKVYRARGRTGQVQRLQWQLGSQLVTWGRRLQGLGEPQAMLP